MTIKIDAEFKALIPALTDEERALLEQSLLNEGCRDALVVWRDTLIDGHNRYELCTQYGIEFKTIERDFQDRNEALLWIIQNQLGRRNLPKIARGELALRLKEVIAEKAKAQQGERTDIHQKSDKSPINTLKELASIADISHDTMHKVSVVIEQAPDVIKQAAKRDEISVNRAYELTRALETVKAQNPTFYAETVARGFVLNLDGEDVPLVEADPTLLRIATNEDEYERTKRQAAYVKEQREKKKQRLTQAADVAPTPEPETPRFAYGDVVRIGNHTLICGDNSSELAKSYLTEYALVFCDIPYNAVTSAQWDIEFLWCHDWLMDFGKTVAVTPGISSIQAFMRATQMPYVWSTATYINNGMARGALGFGNWIYTALFTRDSLYKQTRDYYEISITSNDYSDLGAKRQKPPAYLAWLFDLFCGRGESVLDAFAGSGTSVLVAENLGLACTAIEIDAETFNGMVTRIERALNQQAVKVS